MIPANAKEVSERLSMDPTIGPLFSEPAQLVVVPQFGHPSREFLAVVEVLKAVPERDAIVLIVRRTIGLLRELNVLDNLVGVEILLCGIVAGRVQRLLRYAQGAGLEPDIEPTLRDYRHDDSSLIIYPPLNAALDLAHGPTPKND